MYVLSKSSNSSGELLEDEHFRYNREVTFQCYLLVRMLRVQSFEFIIHVE